MAMQDAWRLVYDTYVPEEEGLREALCTLGNGVFATRGAAAESSADDVHYPGTYIAGLYNRLDTEIAGRTITNEDLVNAPNWLLVQVRIADGPWLSVDDHEVLGYRQELDLRRGVLSRQVRLRDGEGRETALAQRRFVHMRHANLAALQLTVTPLNWSGPLTVRSALDGSVRNDGVARYRDLSDQHLDVLHVGGDDQQVWLRVRTTQSRVEVAQAARTTATLQDAPVATAPTVRDEERVAAHELTVDVAEEQELTVTKTVAMVTSRDRAISEPLSDARKLAGRAGSFDELLADHVLAWDQLWDRFRIEVDRETDGDRTEMILNLHIFHVLQTVSENIIDRDVGVPARGLHGEAYRGHIFWDELFILPYLSVNLPVLTRSLLLYRRRRLDEARAAAAEAGYEGAMYPWQSGSDGREETQVLHLNPKSGRWNPDSSHLQRHINIAIAFNVWHYYCTTGDEQFLRFHGAEMLVEIARFWASLTTYDHARDRYEICGVMGPDEYHEGYPDRDEAGLDNNAYTNVMVVWLLRRTMEALGAMPEHHTEELTELLGITREERDRWTDISEKMLVPFHDGVISQFEGYEELEELDWEGYRQRYGNIQRLDRILEAEGDTPDRYKLSKQADVLMLFFVLGVEEVRDLFAHLGHELDDATITRTIDYYMARTAHGSTLSKVVHAWVMARRQPDRAAKLFGEALEADVSDVQGGTTQEGVHLGAMAGTVDLVQRAWSGLNVRNGLLQFDPQLPADVTGVRFSLHYRGHRLRVEITPRNVTLRSLHTHADGVRIGCCDEEATLQPGGHVSFATVP